MIKVPVYIYETLEPIEDGLVITDRELAMLRDRRSVSIAMFNGGPFLRAAYSPEDLPVTLDFKKITLALVYNYKQRNPKRILALVAGDMEDFKVLQEERETERWDQFWRN